MNAAVAVVVPVRAHTLHTFRPVRAAKAGAEAKGAGVWRGVHTAAGFRPPARTKIATCTRWTLAVCTCAKCPIHQPLRILIRLWRRSWPLQVETRWLQQQQRRQQPQRWKTQSKENANAVRAPSERRSHPPLPRRPPNRTQSAKSKRSLLRVLSLMVVMALMSVLRFHLRFDHSTVNCSPPRRALRTLLYTVAPPRKGARRRHHTSCPRESSEHEVAPAVPRMTTTLPQRRFPLSLCVLQQQRRQHRGRPRCTVTSPQHDGTAYPSHPAPHPRAPHSVFFSTANALHLHRK